MRLILRTYCKSFIQGLRLSVIKNSARGTQGHGEITSGHIEQTAKINEPNRFLKRLIIVDDRPIRIGGIGRILRPDSWVIKVNFRITGHKKPIGEAADKIEMLYQTAGKVVRKYDQLNVPDPLSADADVIIIKQTMEVPNVSKEA